jgi:copper transport protein
VPVKSRLAALLAGLSLAACWAGTAWAHPGLLRSEPAANTTLDAPPARVAVWFDEAFEPDYGNLSVYASDGRRVDNIDTRYLPGPEPGLAVSLPPLPRGSYIAVWRVISVGDGHAVGGAFAFGVGVPPDVAGAAAAGAQADVEPDATSHLIRFLGLFGQMAFAGALAFRALVWAPVVGQAVRGGALSNDAARGLAVELRRFVTVLSDVIVAALIIGVLGALYVQARATGVLFWELFATRWGVVWIGRAVAALLIALWLESLLEGRRPAWVGGLLALAMLLATTLTSHSSARPGLLGPVADFVHQLAAALWLGGLVLLVLALLAARRASLPAEARTALALGWVVRFSSLAAASVGALLASGLLLGGALVPSWTGLLLTPYGQVLLVKLLGVALALGLAAYNALGAARWIARARGSAGRAAALIASEGALVAAVLLGAAVLGDLTPPVTAGAGAEAAAPAGLALEAQAGPLEVRARIEPARLGANVFAVTLTGADGAPVSDAQVELFFQPVGGSALSSRLPLDPVPEAGGAYAASGGGLSRLGPWQILVTITPPGASGAHYANLNLDVGLDGVVRPAGAPLPLGLRAAAWLNQWGRAALITLVFGLAAAWAWLASRSIPGLRRLGWMAVGVLLAVLAWIAVFRLSL